MILRGRSRAVALAMWCLVPLLMLGASSTADLADANSKTSQTKSKKAKRAKCLAGKRQARRLFVVSRRTVVTLDEQVANASREFYAAGDRVGGHDLRIDALSSEIVEIDRQTKEQVDLRVTLQADLDAATIERDDWNQKADRSSGLVSQEYRRRAKVAQGKMDKAKADIATSLAEQELLILTRGTKSTELAQANQVKQTEIAVREGWLANQNLTLKKLERERARSRALKIKASKRC